MKLRPVVVITMVPYTEEGPVGNLCKATPGREGARGGGAPAVGKIDEGAYGRPPRAAQNIAPVQCFGPPGPRGPK